MKEFLFVLLPYVTGWATIAGGVLGGLNHAFGWSLALKIGGSRIDIPEGLDVAVGLLVVGACMIGFSHLADSERVKRFFAQGPRTWAMAAAGLTVAGFVFVQLVDRFEHGDRAHWGAATGRVEVVTEELAEPGRPADLADRLLFPALRYDRAEVVEALLKAGADPNARRPQELGEGRRTPALCYAAWYASPEVVKRLLDAGADPNAADTKGFNVLMFGAGFRLGELPAETRMQVVEHLLAAGADPAAKNPFGSDAAGVARSYGKKAVAERLEEAVAAKR